MSFLLDYKKIELNNMTDDDINKEIMSSKQTKGLKRNTIDKYYTKGSVVELCINYIKEKLLINENDLVIEPSAGDGSFIEVI